jgi:RsiW-degrading membrane proteinase PrsW (M82 family)
VPLLHGLFAGLLAFFIGLAANLPAVRTSLLWIGLLVAAVLHGTYDAALSGQGPNPWLAFGVALLTLLLFVSNSSSADQIAARLNAEQGKGAAAAGRLDHLSGLPGARARLYILPKKPLMSK